MTSGNDQPAIIAKVFGEEYGGPLSHFDEWHALEYGLWAGFVAARPEVAAVIAAVVGVNAGKQVATGRIRKQILREWHYFATTAVVVYALLTSLMSGVVPL